MQRVNLNERGLMSFRTGNDSRASKPGGRPNKPDAEPESRSQYDHGYQ
jgi:hypothetical protein